MEIGNNMLDYQILDSQNLVIELPLRASGNSTFQEQASSLTSANNTASTSSSNTTTNTNSTNTTIASLIPQYDVSREHVIKCYCDIDAVLREVKVNTKNKGRFFWSCSKFGGTNHLRRCNFFEWDSASTKIESDDNDVVAESSSASQNKHNGNNGSELPFVLIEPADINNINNNNNFNGDEEVNLSPCPDQLSDNEMAMSRSVSRTRTTTITTSQTIPHQRNKNSNRSASSIQASCSRSQSPHTLNTTNETSNATTTTVRNTTNNANDSHTINTTRSLTNNSHTRSPIVFGNWDNVPKYSAPQLLDIVQNHLLLQGKVASIPFFLK